MLWVLFGLMCATEGEAAYRGPIILTHQYATATSVEQCRVDVFADRTAVAQSPAGRPTDQGAPCCCPAGEFTLSEPEYAAALDAVATATPHVSRGGLDYAALFVPRISHDGIGRDMPPALDAIVCAACEAQLADPLEDLLKLPAVDPAIESVDEPSR